MVSIGDGVRGADRRRPQHEEVKIHETHSTNIIGVRDPSSSRRRRVGPPRATGGVLSVLRPPLPAPESTGTVDVNGASIHYALYGSGNADAVLLLHGGLGSAEDFGAQIEALAAQYKVVAIDSRGHGRSTDDDQPYGYHLMASDVMGVMDSLGIDEAAVVGWSDGGNIGLDLAINNPDRLTRVFALGANYQTSGVRPSVFHDALIGDFVGAAAEQYARISPTPDAFEAFLRQSVRDVGRPASPKSSWRASVSPS